MRIAFVSHSRRKIGGAEVYLDSVIPALARAGHEVACLYETDPLSDRAAIACPEDAPSWCASNLGVTPSLEKLKSWGADVIYTHGLFDPAIESAVIGVAPAVLYVHSYYGTCISGNKLHNTSTPRVCERRFGPACLLHYFPDHCGGSNPLTMLSRYRLQSRRLELMRRYRALIANSQHMVRELAHHDLQSECVYPFAVSTDVVRVAAQPSFEDDPLRLIFAGRMSSLKGGVYLLSAIPDIQRALGRKLHITFAGDGPDREEWQRLAALQQNESTTFDFPGWLAATDLQSAISRSHLLIFPSIWPEPFGLSGPEAGLLGVPSVAFAVGGVPEWLGDGVTGHLASVPPTSAALAQAILKALSSAEHYSELRAGAYRQAHRYQLADHLAQLTRIFEKVAA